MPENMPDSHKSSSFSLPPVDESSLKQGVEDILNSLSENLNYPEKYTIRQTEGAIEMVQVFRIKDAINTLLSISRSRWKFSEKPDKTRWLEIDDEQIFILIELRVFINPILKINEQFETLNIVVKQTQFQKLPDIIFDISTHTLRSSYYAKIDHLAEITEYVKKDNPPSYNFHGTTVSASAMYPINKETGKVILGSQVNRK